MKKVFNRFVDILSEIKLEITKYRNSNKIQGR